MATMTKAALELLGVTKFKKGTIITCNVHGRVEFFYGVVGSLPTRHLEVRVSESRMSINSPDLERTRKVRIDPETPVDIHEPDSPPTPKPKANRKADGPKRSKATPAGNDRAKGSSKRSRR